MTRRIHSSTDDEQYTYHKQAVPAASDGTNEDTESIRSRSDKKRDARIIAEIEREKRQRRKHELGVSS